MAQDADVAKTLSNICDDIRYVKDWMSAVRVDDTCLFSASGLKVGELDQELKYKIDLILFLEKYRSIRDSAFEEKWVNCEPCWHILLDCYRHEIQPLNRIYSVKNACFAAGTPPTTALRYVSLLVDSGYLHKELDKNDARRSFLKLTERGRGLVEVSLHKILNAKRINS